VDAGQREQLQRAMAALSAGDRSAFEPVFSALWPLLRRFCERTLHDPDLACDAAQAALMKLLLHATDFRAGHDVVTWALGFASFECLTVRNRANRRREHTDDTLLAAIPAGQPSPEDAAIREDLGVAALMVLGTLRPQDVETIKAAFPDARAVASTAAFRKRLQRALERLRAAWRQTHGSDV
jgi:DNA-directed RNA polymerase specialized sigma24 family protein